MNKYDDHGNNNICPYKRGKVKGNEDIKVDSTYCRKCWHYMGVSKRGKNNGVIKIICGMENKCLIDKNKTCNQCHECEVEILDPNYK